tara:strand:- start:90 stop:650 length:561 start_codon:yes stop_codon:yes gene_type:complete
MIISVSINEVLRGILSRFEEIYEKYEGKKVKSPVTTPNLLEHVDFKDEDELFQFLYSDAPMEIFGQAKECTNNVISHLVDLYKDRPDGYTLRVVSDDVGRGKSATLWFLAKYGLVCDEIIFYTNSTIPTLWEDTDLFITTDVEIINNKPTDKKLIIVDKIYNKTEDSNLRIDSIKELTSFENACKK